MRPPATAMPTRRHVAAAPTARLTVEVKHDLAFTPDDEAALDALIESRPNVGVFVSKAWLSGHFAEPPCAGEPCVVLLREKHVLRAIVPLTIRHTRALTRIGLLGGGGGSDLVDLVAAPGFEAAASDAFLEWLGAAFGRRAFIMALRDVPVDSPLWGAVYRANRSKRLPLTMQPHDLYTLPTLDLADVWSSAVTADHAGRHGPSIEKHRRWLERRGRVSVRALRDPGEVADAFETLTRLLHARWGARSALDDARALRFHRRVLPQLLAERRLRMLEIAVDARVVAVFYGLATATWWGYYFAGYDREWAGRIHLGRIALAMAIDRALYEGATEFDFLKGAEQVKYFWPVRTRATLNADLYSAHGAAQLVRAAAATRDAGIAVAKTTRRLFGR